MSLVIVVLEGGAERPYADVPTPALAAPTAVRAGGPAPDYCALVLLLLGCIVSDAAVPLRVVAAASAALALVAAARSAAFVFAVAATAAAFAAVAASASIAW